MKWVVVLSLGLWGCNSDVDHPSPVAPRIESEPSPKRHNKVKPPPAPKSVELPVAVLDAGVDAAAPPEPWEPTEADCYYLQAPIARAWPEADQALQSAAARWRRWYVPGDPSCAIRVLDITNPRFDDWGRVGDILLDPDDPEIVDGDDCEGEHYLLIDVFTHELGYAYGLEWTGARGRAMSTPEYCSPVVPTAAEISAVR